MKKLLTAILSIVCLIAVAQDDNRVVRIPVVFHIIYAEKGEDNGINHDAWQNGNSTQYLPTQKILAELNDLHKDFLLLNTDTSEILNKFKSIVGKPNIDFYLADSVFQPGGEKGIIRVYSKKNKHQLWKRSQIIDPSKYLNVYIGNIGGSYAPSDHTWDYPSNDAIYLGYDWVGQGYRLLTHEAGHWLGLLHIFGGSGGSKGDFCKEGDHIDDTPFQKTRTDDSCQFCPPSVPDQSCTTGEPSNYNNFMDYSGCRKMFTSDQVTRMREVLRLHRNTLWQSSKLTH